MRSSQGEHQDRWASLPLNAVLFVGGAIVANVAERLIGERIADPKSVLGWAFIAFSIAVIAFVLARIYAAIHELQKQQAFRLNFYPCTTSKETIQAYTALMELMRDLPENKQTSVRVLNLFVESFQQLHGEAEKSRRKYLEVIEQKINKVNYHRIVQVRAQEIDGTWIRRVAQNYQDHFGQILKKRGQSSSVTTLLEVVPAVYPLTFIIITAGTNRNYLLWQIEEHIPYSNADTNSYEVAGYLIIADPEQLIIEHFSRMFNKVAEDPERRTITPQILSGERAQDPTLSPPASANRIS